MALGIITNTSKVGTVSTSKLKSTYTKKYSKLISRLAKDMVPLMKSRFIEMDLVNTGALIDSINYIRKGANLYQITLGDANTERKTGKNPGNYAGYVDEGRGPTWFRSPGPVGRFTVPKGYSVQRRNYPAVNSFDYAYKKATEKFNRL